MHFKYLYTSDHTIRPQGPTIQEQKKQVINQKQL